MGPPRPIGVLTLVLQAKTEPHSLSLIYSQLPGKYGGNIVLIDLTVLLSVCPERPLALLLMYNDDRKSRVPKEFETRKNKLLKATYSTHYSGSMELVLVPIMSRKVL